MTSTTPESELDSDLATELPAGGFAALGAHPSLVTALGARGYDTPTPVQAAALGASEQDLLVSSRTGSGKTIAFGLIMGRLLLGEAPKIKTSRQPRGLVIAPTRELAAQVQRELSWLFAETGARVAAFTGGTDLRGDARTIMRGVDIAVGTPGRLVDLTERKSLDLSGIEVLVLDEADEMLDMGFREAIEGLLAQAPAERRTLLFSATMPPAIRALAKKYQKNALPLDAKQDKSTAGSGHEDISYIAHLCANKERVAALVNLLRMADDERSLVFCRTREAVGELHRELASRGFLAAAISGDRAQSERDRALETMRQGRVRVLVATNVAARGLDLPELGLVVHSDLPENVEALTHRSGRTGRAGKKGRSVFLVEIGQRRKAERLFSAARIKITFSPAPSLEMVAQHEHDALQAELIAAAEAPITEAAATLASELLSNSTPEALVGALVDRLIKERPAGEKLTPIAVGPAPRLEAPKPSHHAGDEFTLFQVNLGIGDKAAANWILPLVCKRGAITRREVGAIRITRDRTYFEVLSRVAAEFAANAGEIDPRAPKVRIERAEDQTLPPRAFAAGKPSYGETKPGVYKGSKPGFGEKPGGYKGKKPFTKPGFDRPAFDKPGFDRSSAPRPSYRDAGPPGAKPPARKPGFGKPSFGKPGSAPPRPKPR